MSPKELLRGEIKKYLKTVSGEEFRSQGAKAVALLCSSGLWARYESVFLFLSMNSEIDTWFLLETALKEGKKVFAPRVEARRLVFCPLRSSDGPWHKGSFGISEPSGSHDSVGSSEQVFQQTKGLNFRTPPCLILAPGLAFDREGNRLGRGGGYYDRFFAELDVAGREYTALGLCMDFQVMDNIPVAENDKKVNGLLTGKDLYIAKH